MPEPTARSRQDEVPCGPSRAPPARGGPPAELNNVPRTVFDDNNSRHFYDQIAWFSDPTKPDAPALLEGMQYTRHGGGFDFIPHALRDLTKTQVSWRISDHYPLWVEFTI
jgi:hypothetical protein